MLLRIYIALALVQSVLCVVFMVLLWRRTRLLGSYAVRMEAAAERAENAAIHLRAWVAEVDRLRHDHPVIPPDSLPDDTERSVA